MAEEQSVLEMTDDYEAPNEQFYRAGITDGLPIVPPTEERVERMLRSTRRRPEEVIAILAPKRGVATVEKIAINGVMAGCRPEYMPVLIAAVEAFGEELLNLHGILGSTHNCSPLLIVNGPIAQELDISCGPPLTPNRWRASAAIGRAIMLITINIAGVPLGTHVDTQGPIVRYYHCIAENEEQSPWEPLHVERGFDRKTSTVTVFGACPPQHIDDMGAKSAKSVLRTIAHSMATAGSRNSHAEAEPLVILGPQHAATIARDGFSKADVKRFLYERARLPLAQFPPDNLVSLSARWRKFYEEAGPEAQLPCADRPEDIAVVVMGGSGTHSLFVQTLVGSRSVTKAIL